MMLLERKEMAEVGGRVLLTTLLHGGFSIWKGRNTEILAGWLRGWPWLLCLERCGFWKGFRFSIPREVLASVGKHLSFKPGLKAKG